jgi:pyruvate kinase
MLKQRRTKIVVTLGPATDDLAVLEQMIAAGVDVVRLNFSHGTHQEHQGRMEKVRQCAAKLKREVGILADLQGPKIRVACFKNKKIMLKEGAKFILDAALADDMGTEECVGIDYKDLPNDVKRGDTLLLDDGRLVLSVTDVNASKIICQVGVGGELSDHKGINRLGGGLSARALTEKDIKDLKFVATMNVDYVAISFPRGADDVNQAKALLKAANTNASVIAKIERTEAVKAIDEIIQASDGVMVARGDLAVEIGEAEVPAVQKLIIHRARALDKPVITATQMMESMIHSSVPTRAEVSDVANAVLDGTDAVMLSAETAIGDNPAKVVATMARVCLSAEKSLSTQISKHRLECHFQQIDEAIAMATMYAANHMDVTAIIALTESGSTPLLMSRIRSGIPIFGLSRHALTRGKMVLYRGVYPINFDVTKCNPIEVNRDAIATVQQQGFLCEGDLVIITKGDSMGVHGGTNTMKIVRVSDKQNNKI